MEVAMQEVRPTDSPAIEAFKFGSGCRWTSEKIGVLGGSIFATKIIGRGTKS